MPPVHLYVDAALRRTQTLLNLRSGHTQDDPPKIFEILVDDLRNAHRRLTELMDRPAVSAAGGSPVLQPTR